MKLLSEAKIHGGKSYLCDKIFKCAPQSYTHYADLFMGAGSMTYNAPTAQDHIACDINKLRVQSKLCIRDHLERLKSLLKFVTYTEMDFETAKRILLRDEGDCCYRSAAWIAVSRMSRGGLGRTFAWSDRERGGRPGDVNAWASMILRLPQLSERLQPVQLVNGSAFDWLIKSELRKPKWFIYLDPPYAPDSRTTKADEYDQDELTIDDHERLVSIVKDHPAQIAISHYKHPLYDSLCWRTVEFEVPNHSGQGDVKQRRTELLYYNYPDLKEPRWMTRISGKSFIPTMGGHK